MERQNTMNQITQVLDKRCKPCEHYSANVNATICAACPHGEKLKRLGNRLTELTKERSEMKQTKKEPFKAPTAEKPARYRPTMAETNELKGKITVLEKEVEAAKGESSEWEHKYNQLLKGFQSLKESNTELTDQLEEKTKQVDELMNSFSDEKIPEVNSELEKQVKLYELEQKRAKERYNELLEAYEAAEQSTATLTDLLEVKNKEVQELTQSIESVTLPDNNNDLARLEEVNGAMRVLLKDYFVNQ
ncbi:zinc-finger domain-containing protein [Priestia aryabhattai]|nr:zinc-finger domain-containing protein [Priestia aryabhattai]